MTIKLFDLTYRTARELGYLDEGVATGGSTTTLIDTKDRTEDDDYWNGGTVWIILDYAGAGAAPELECSIVSDFVNSTGTVTLRDAVTVAIASGDRYAIASDWVPLHIIISKINQALMDMGVIPYTDSTTITIAANQTEYTLPRAAHQELTQVWIQYDTDTNDNEWEEVLNWRVQANSIGSAATLILPYQYTSGYKIMLVYNAVHPELYMYGDNLSDAIPIERVVYPAIRDCFLWLKQRTRRTDWDNDIGRWEARAENVKATRQIYKARKPSKVATFQSDRRGYPGDRTPR